MKEVTRIHLAKTSYDIEVTAKKELEKYIKSLEAYTQDAEVLEDIEIRMTEILAERNVQPGGVITSDDISAVRKQLGEPHEFADESGDVAIGTVTATATRRYYRNTDNGVLGGVLSGVGTYFGFNPLWARLAFIVLFFISWGTVLLVYVVLWIAVPAARTAAEKLQLEGKPATLASIRELNETSASSTDNRTAKQVQRVLSILFGVASAGAALLAFIATIGGAIALFTGWSLFSLEQFVPLGHVAAWAIYLLSILSGLLLTLMFSVIAYALLRQTWTKRIGVLLAATVIAGVLSASTAIGIGVYRSWEANAQLTSSVRESKVNLPETFSQVKTLTSSSNSVSIGWGDYSDLSIEYIVDTGKPRYVFTALPDVKLDIKVEGDTASVTVDAPKNHTYGYGVIAPRLTIYGPALSEVINEKGYLLYSAKQQDELVVRSTKSTVSVSGEFAKISTYGTGNISLDNSSIQELIVDAKVGSYVSAGVVRTLTVMQPDICPTASYSGYDQQNRVVVAGVSSNEMTYNGAVIPATTQVNNCAILIIGSEEDFHNEYSDQALHR